MTNTFIHAKSQTDVKLKKISKGHDFYYFGSIPNYQAAFSRKKEERQSVSNVKPLNLNPILLKCRYNRNKTEESVKESHIDLFIPLTRNFKDERESQSSLGRQITRSVKKRVQSEFNSQQQQCSFFQQNIEKSVQKQQVEQKNLLIPYLNQLKKHKQVAFMEKSSDGQVLIKKKRNISEYNYNAILKSISERNMALYELLEQKKKRKYQNLNEIYQRVQEIQKIIQKMNLIVNYVDQVQNKKETSANVLKQLYKEETFIDLQILLKNLPLNLEQLRHYSGNERNQLSVIKRILKISPKMTKFLFVDLEDNPEKKLKKINIPSQLFHILIWNTDIIEENKVFEFQFPLPDWILNTINFLEMMFVQGCDAKSLFQLKLRKKKLTKNLIPDSNTQIELILQMEFITELFCFNKNLEEVLDEYLASQKESHTLKRDRSKLTEFIEHLDLSNRNHLQIRQLLEKSKLTNLHVDSQIDLFEKKYGKIQNLSFSDKQDSKLIYLKSLDQ